jgi:hypothetical protein
MPEFRFLDLTTWRRSDWAALALAVVALACVCSGVVLVANS